MSTPRVSIVTPVYNGAKYLDESVRGALGQTFPDWELLLIDDGSSDGSDALARGYAARHPGRVRYLEHPGRANRGQFATRVFGAGQARGEVVALLDQDDVWDPDYLAGHLALWDAAGPRGVALSYGPSRYWFFDGPTRVGAADFVQPMPPGGPRVYAPGELLEPYYAAYYANTPCPSCTLARRDLFPGVQRFARRAWRSHFEDQYLWWYVAARWPVAVHDRVWVRYRQHDTSAVNVLAEDRRRSRRSELDFLRAIRRDLAGCRPGHPLLAGGVLDARIAELRRGRWGDALRAVLRPLARVTPPPVKRLARRWLGPAAPGGRAAEGS